MIKKFEGRFSTGHDATLLIENREGPYGVVISIGSDTTHITEFYAPRKQLGAMALALLQLADDPQFGGSERHLEHVLQVAEENAMREEARKAAQVLEEKVLRAEAAELWAAAYPAAYPAATLDQSNFDRASGDSKLRYMRIASRARVLASERAARAGTK